MFKIIFALITFTATAIAATPETDKANIFNKNLLENGGFEYGKTKWTASAGTFAVTTSSPMVGLVHATWDAAASGNTLTSTAVTIPSGMHGRSAVASCLFTTASGTATHTIQAYDGTNILSSNTITSSTTPTRSSANFVMPSSDSISLRVVAVAADEVSISLDDCYLGPAEGYNVASVSQAQFVGSIAFANDCNWLVSGAAYADLTADASCTTTIEGTGLSLVGATRPGVTISNAKPGRYVAVWSGNLYKNNANSFSCAFRFFDGTNVWGQAGSFANGYSAFGGGLVGDYTVTSPQSSIELEVQTGGDGGAVSCGVYGGGLTSNKISVYYYPTSQDQVYSPDKLANSWSGYHDSTCSWARTNTAYGDPTADASCALVERTNNNFGTVSTSGSVLPAITFTPSRAGRYYVCATATVTNSTAGQTGAIKLWDGTTTIAERDTYEVGAAMGISVPVCGVYVASNTSAKTLSLQIKASSGAINITNVAAASVVEWSIFQIDQSFPMPLMANSVTSSSSGVVRTEAGRITCSSSSSIVSQLGNWIASVGNVSAGACVVSFVANTFSAAPYCKMTEISSNPSAVLGINTVSSSSVTTDCDAASSGADCTNNTYDIMCIGAK